MSPRVIEETFKRHSTGRWAAVVCVEDFGSPVSVDAGDYVLVIASEKPTVALSIRAATHLGGCRRTV
jgi:hypothetical protein